MPTSTRPGSVTSQIILWGSVVVILAGMVWGLAALNSGKSSSTNVGTPAPVSATDHIRGSKTAPAVIIEYSDFQCPACKVFEPILKQLTDSFGTKLAIVYRPFPLRGVHQYADLSSQAAEAADLQGSFWAYHDILFERQDTWAASSDVKSLFVSYAKELGLNTTTFAKDMDSTAVKDKVNTDYNTATAMNVNSTPTFFLNGKHIDNPATVDAFSQLVQDAINGKK